MRLSEHVVLSAVVSVVVWAATKSPELTVSCFLSGIFIDLDHLYDFYVAKKRLTFSHKELVQYCVKEKAGQLILFLHSYELFAILWILAAVFKMGDLYLGTLIGMTIHMIADQIFNPLKKPWGYFFIYRYKLGFEKKAILTPEFYASLQ